jgi:NADPH-dependent 2,4-dienoyl-CoA reductase/sulfur reductase-like enzyme
MPHTLIGMSPSVFGGVGGLMVRVAVVGGGAAGMTAASRVRKLVKDAQISVFEESEFVSYAPCGIPYLVEGLVHDPADLTMYSPEFFRKERNIDVHTSCRVENIDLSAKTLTYQENEEQTPLSWDKLVLATGAEPIVPKIGGIEMENVFTAKFIEDGIKIRKAAAKAKDVVVVGGGYIGVEMAEAFVVSGKRVTVMEMLPNVLANLDPEVSEIVQNELSANRVVLKLEENVLELLGGDEVKRVVTDKGEYSADLVVVAVGFRPKVEIAEKIGARIGGTGAIDVEDTMETSLADVFACGDCAETTHLVTGKKVWIPLGPTANKMGYVAGTNLFGGTMRFPGIVGTAFTKVFDLRVARTGLTENEAKGNGFEVSSALIRAGTRAHYYPSSEQITLKIISDRATGRLLGAQCVGKEGVTGRINAFSALLGMKASTRDLFFSDFGYAPPFAHVWDPLVIAARVIGVDGNSR